MNLKEAPTVTSSDFYEPSIDEKQNAKINPGDLSVGDVVVLSTTPHGEDIENILTVEIVETPRESTKELLRDGERAMADIRFEDKDGESYTFHCDNGYVTGYHSGLERSSDIAKGAVFYALELFADDDETALTDGGTTAASADVETPEDADEWRKDGRTLSIHEKSPGNGCTYDKGTTLIGNEMAKLLAKEAIDGHMTTSMRTAYIELAQSRRALLKTRKTAGIPYIFAYATIRRKHPDYEG